MYAQAVNFHSQLLTFLFQILLMLAVFEPTFPLAAETALIIALLLICARILCIYYGKYLYKFPNGMQI
jgi:hypothetical protein